MLHNPYLADGFEWLRGNLHAHTTRTDGRLTPEEVIAEYEQRGYDFLALSDHDLLIQPEEFQARTRMTLIPADEITRHGPHILAVQIGEVVVPHPDRQQAIDAVTAQGGFAILNHPSWQREYAHFTQELMEGLTGYAGIEIYNGVVERLEGSAHAVDRWDRLLSTGRRVWGYAHDDSHWPVDYCRGWNVVQAKDRSVAAICEALRNGRFYASTGVEIARIGADGDALTIEAPDAQRIRFVGALGKELAYVDGTRAAYRLTGDESGYVRVECYGRGVATAWTQPFFVS